MKRLLGAALAVAFMGATVAVPAALAQETKWARGTIGAMGGDSLTLKVGDREMKFHVDKSTEVIAKGGSTKSAAAQAEGRGGPTLSDVLKVGESVEVHYREPAMHAVSVRVVSGMTPGTSDDQKPKAETDKPKTITTTGTVTAVSGNSLAIKTGSGEMKFVVDSTTKAMGEGMGTKAREQAAAGKATLITDFVAVGDLVRVDYSETGGAKHAAEVHVTRKAIK